MSRPVTQVAERERELARARSQRLKQAAPSLPGESVSRGFADRGALEGYPSHYTSLMIYRYNNICIITKLIYKSKFDNDDKCFCVHVCYITSLDCFSFVHICHMIWLFLCICVSPFLRWLFLCICECHPSWDDCFCVYVCVTLLKMTVSVYMCVTLLEMTVSVYMCVTLLEMAASVFVCATLLEMTVSVYMHVTLREMTVSVYMCVTLLEMAVSVYMCASLLKMTVSVYMCVSPFLDDCFCVYVCVTLLEMAVSVYMCDILSWDGCFCVYVCVTLLEMAVSVYMCDILSWDGCFSVYICVWHHFFRWPFNVHICGILFSDDCFWHPLFGPLVLNLYYLYYSSWLCLTDVSLTICWSGNIYRPWTVLEYIFLQVCTENISNIGNVCISGIISCSFTEKKCHHFEEIFIIGCTESCHFKNFQCSQWWKFHQNDNISVSVTGLLQPSLN